MVILGWLRPLNRARRLVSILPRYATLGRLRPILWPPQRSQPWWASVLIVLAGSLVAFFRLGELSLRGVVWAEDGAVFLTDLHGSGFWDSVLKPYAGYPQVAARLLTWLAARVPMEAQGLLIGGLAASVVGLLGLVVQRVVQAHVHNQVAPLVAALVVCACPTGPETVLAVANLQWYLLPVACVAVFVLPTTRWALVATCTVMAAYVLTSPFGMGPVLLAAAAFLVTRTRQAAWLAGTSAVALAVAGTVMLSAPARGQELGSGRDATIAVRGFLARVVGDGVWGIARHDTLPSMALGPALVVLALISALGSLLWLAGRRAALVLPTVLAGLSLGIWLLILVLSGLDPSHALIGGRYAVPSTILFVLAVVLLISAGFEEARARAWPSLARGALAGTLLLALGYGLTSSYLVPNVYGRGDVPTWATEVDRARERCVQSGVRDVDLAIAPPTWTARIPCADLRD